MLYFVKNLSQKIAYDKFDTTNSIVLKSVFLHSNVRFTINILIMALRSLILNFLNFIRIINKKKRQKRRMSSVCRLHLQVPKELCFYSFLKLKYMSLFNYMSAFSCQNFPSIGFAFEFSFGKNFIHCIQYKLPLEIPRKASFMLCP